MPTTRAELVVLLAELETPGDTCAGGAAPELPSLPGLEVEGVGQISLPLNEVQAKALAAAAVQAPHGKGRKTVVDTSVRNTLQIEPSKVRLRNPGWQAALARRVSACAEALGVNKGLVKAELYKLLLYEPGGFFKSHRDTEKAGGMFGTLVIQLPSTYTGGTFEVRHGGKQKAFTMGAGSEAAYGCQYVCHYADCEHELKPVESGFRLALVYSLCYTGEGDYTPSAEGVGGVSELAARIEFLPKDESLLVLNLVHQYTTASLGRLGTGCLKGADRARCQALQAATDGAYSFYIACAQRTDYETMEGDPHYGDEVIDTDQGEPDITEVFAADGSDGSGAIKKLRIDWASYEDGGAVLASEDEVEEMWGEGDPGNTEYTGNEGASRETTYRCCVLLAYPQAAELELLCKADLAGFVRSNAPSASVGKLFRIIRFIDQNLAAAARALGTNERVLLLRSLSSVFLKVEEPSKPKVVQMIKTILCDIPEEEVDMDHHRRECGLSDSLVTEIVTAVQRCGWTTLEKLVTKLVELVRASSQATASIPIRADLAVKLKADAGAGDGHHDRLLKQLATDLLDALHKPPATTAPGYSSAYSSLRCQKADRSDVLTRRSMEVLFKAGDAADLERLVSWAVNATEPELKTAIDAMTAAEPAADGPAGDAVGDAHRRIIELQRSAKIKVLQARRVELEAATRDGEPSFTWAMRKASSVGDPSILSYLRGTESGPRTFIVGGGITNARSICASLRGQSYYGYGCSSNPDHDAAILHRGFSASGSEGGTGGNAWVAVQKTKAYHEARVTDFRDKTNELKQLREQVMKLSGGDAGSSSTADNPPNSKRQRTTASSAPPPPGATVVGVDSD